MLILQAEELDTSVDHTFVAYAHSPMQAELIKRHPPQEAIFVEGGFNVWLRQKCLTYFVLKSEALANPVSHLEQIKMDEKAKDESESASCKSRCTLLASSLYFHLFK